MATALADCPADLWARNGICPPERTIMLAATSKRIRDLLDQLPRQVPARVKVKRMEGLDVGLPRMLKWLSITVLEMCGLGLGAEGAGRLAGVLGHCGALAHLNLAYNGIGTDGAGRLAGVLGQCGALAHRDLADNVIRADGAGREGVV